MKKDFEYWLINIAKKKNGKTYAERTVNKYSSSIEIICKEFSINFWNFDSLNDLFMMRTELYKKNDFKLKNERGNCMYSRAVEMYIEYIFSKNIDQIREDIIKIEKDNTLSYEEKNAYIETLCNLRNSQFQQNFRKELLNEFDNKCALCEINDKRFLIASHIIAYSDCVNKTDLYKSYNGLLLCIMHDVLFDKHFISFDTNGKILISNSIDEKIYSFFNINKSLSLDNIILNKERKKCLKSHLFVFNQKNDKL